MSSIDGCQPNLNFHISCADDHAVGYQVPSQVFSSAGQRPTTTSPNSNSPPNRHQPCTSVEGVHIGLAFQNGLVIGRFIALVLSCPPSSGSGVFTRHTAHF